MSAKERLRKTVVRLDEEHAGGRLRRWWLRNAVLGGVWGDFVDEVRRIEPGATVLDLGAGEAGLRGELAHARYLAVDRGIGHAGWDYSSLDAVADASAVPLRAGSVDVVISKQVLEHMRDPVGMLREVARVLRPGGRVLLSTNQAWPQHQVPYDFFRFTSYGLRHCFTEAGLVVDRLEAMGGAFTVALFQFTQTLSPHLWARSQRAQRLIAALLTPFRLALRVLTPLASVLDRRDLTKDNTLGWYVVGSRPAQPR